MKPRKKTRITSQRKGVVVLCCSNPHRAATLDRGGVDQVFGHAQTGKWGRFPLHVRGGYAGQAGVEGRVFPCRLKDCDAGCIGHASKDRFERGLGLRR